MVAEQSCKVADWYEAPAMRDIGGGQIGKLAVK